MNKNTEKLVRAAINTGMSYVIPVNYTRCRSLSRKASGVQYCDYRASSDPYVFILRGTAADIRKGIKYVERLDIYPLYTNYPVLRNGRTYELTVSEGYWTVSRIDNNRNKKPLSFNDKGNFFDNNVEE